MSGVEGVGVEAGAGVGAGAGAAMFHVVKSKDLDDVLIAVAHADEGPQF